MSGEKKINSLFVGETTGGTLKWRFHPLIHTQLGLTLAQYFVGCQDKRTGRGEILSFGVGGLNSCQDTAKLELLGGVKTHTKVLPGRN